MTSLSTNKKSQQQRILHRLKKGSVTTLQLRKEEDVFMPNARIWELRHEQGYNIKLTWINGVTDLGVSHRIGKYTLYPGEYKKSCQR